MTKVVVSPHLAGPESSQHPWLQNCRCQVAAVYKFPDSGFETTKRFLYYLRNRRRKSPYNIREDTANFLPFQNNFIKEVMEAFDEAGITIPLPQQEVRLVGQP